MPTPISISVNFDSMNEAFGFPAGFRDPSFFVGYDRLVSLLDRHSLHATLFMIGRDLENPEIRARVREWHSAGFEIGNHSYSHHMNLGALPDREIEDEIALSHDLIGEATGVAPRGFIAPAWASSRRLSRILVKLGYRYDTSLFPSAAIFPITLRIAANHLRSRAKLRRIVDRRDWLYWASMPGTPFLVGDGGDVSTTAPMVMLPLPARSRLAIPHWHTKGFIFGWEKHYAELARLVRNHPFFYYLIHPADFVSASDLPAGFNHSLERLDLPVEDKLARLDESFAILKASGRACLSMEGLAEAARDGMMAKKHRGGLERR